MSGAAPHAQPLRVPAGLPLPDSLMMAYELRPNMYPPNAGVMLMHVPYLKRTYNDFLK